MFIYIILISHNYIIIKKILIFDIDHNIDIPLKISFKKFSQTLFFIWNLFLKKVETIKWIILYD